MDYVALHTPETRPLGVHYNSKTAPRGIRYYVPKKKSVILSSIEADEQRSHSKKHRKKRPKKSKKHGNKSVIVEVDTKEEFELVKDLELAEKIFKDNSREVEAIDKFEPEAKSGSINYYDPEKVAKAKDDNSKFLIQVVDREVDFAQLGIQPAKLSRSDEKWLQKAQYYFINAKENGRKIGSAEVYTSPDILYALWSTAEHVGIDPKRFLVQVYNESRFNPNVRGKAGERGIGQFKHGTAKMLGYDWSKMKGGHKTFAYQALASAEFVKSVGEMKYNGAGRRSEKYVDLISKRLKSIERTKV